MGLILLGLVLFVLLVIVHELGHFVAARRNGVEVEEFGLGFPPKIWGKKLKSKMLFTINVLPLGGFVRLKGEHDADCAPGSYGAAKLWPKTKIVMAGVAVNLLVAIGILMVLAWIGMPQIIENQFTVASDSNIIKNEVIVGYVEADSPAAKAGIKQQDQLVKVGDASFENSRASDLPAITKNLAGQSVTIVVKHDGQEQTHQVTLRSKAEVEPTINTDNPKGYLGIAPTEYTLQRSTWSAPIVALGLTKQFTALTLKGLGTVITQLLHGQVQQAKQQVSGPVGIFILIKEGSLLGFQFILMIIAIISLTLAIMNALPIPALDGGRLFITYLFRILHKPLTQEKEELINGIGFVVLMIVLILVTIVDIKKL